jgi:adenine deaminase
MAASGSGQPPQRVVGRVVDVLAREVRPAALVIRDGRIVGVESVPAEQADGFLLPGFIDAHVHVESSMLVPSEFARQAAVHGTVAAVSDPHEIGNVLGVPGVQYMLDNAACCPFKFFFGAPSCVPATEFETAGAAISVAEVEALLDDPRIVYLSEMMNFPGVLAGNPACLAKIAAARSRGKRIDGHAPGLRGEAAARYVRAGMTTDHECFSKEEALDKLAAGCKIAIREGSAARNFDALWELIGERPGQVMLCSDDKHPDELLEGHIDALVRRAVARGVDVFDALRAACLTPIDHYGLDRGPRPVGRLRTGDPADFIEVDSLESLRVRRTWIDGRLVASGGKTLIERTEPTTINRFVPARLTADQIATPCSADRRLLVIEALDGQLITRSVETEPTCSQGLAVADPRRDLLKLVVVNRYAPAPPAVAFVRGFGLQRGALASSVAHDSHNVIAAGANDDDLLAAIDAVMEARGGLSAACAEEGARLALPLPVAGLMATGTCAEVGAAYRELDRAVKAWGATLRSPYMTLSFMALLVIPELKLSDRGLFDGSAFRFTPLMR